MGVLPSIFVDIWYEKVSDWTEFVNEQSKGIVLSL